MRWDAESQTITQVVSEPDEEDLRSFMLVFRQFVSECEPVFLPRAANDCRRFLTDLKPKSELAKAIDFWKTTVNKVGAFGLTIDRTPITGEYILDLWINGAYFHNDQHKAEELRRHLSSGFLPLVRAHFLGVLADRTNVILYHGSVVNYGLRNSLFDFGVDKA